MISDLNDFIRKFFQGQSESIVKGLSVIFQLNMILLKDEADQISRGNISPLFDLLIEVNRDAIVITDVLTEMSKKENQGRFFELRGQFNLAVTHFAQTTLSIIAKKSHGQQLNIKTFILESAKKIGINDVDADTIDAVIFLKKILVGGARDIITADEVEQLIGKVPAILNLTFDMFYVSGNNFKSDADYAQFYLENIREMYKVIEFNQDNFQLLKVDQLTKLIKKVIGPTTKFDVDKFTPTLIALKSKLLKSDGDAFMLLDAKTILNLVEEITEQLYFDTLTYDAYQETLAVPNAITYLAPIKLPGYEYLSERRLKELQENFQEIAIKFRYFRDETTHLQYYGNEFKRSKYGFIELSAMRYVSTKILNSYGHDDNKNERQVSLLEFQAFLIDMKPVLQEFGLWTSNFETFARNAIFLADLFQNQSNGDFSVNTNEATEYISMIMAAVQLNTNVENEMSHYCDTGINKDDPLIYQDCYNEHFYEVLLNKLEYKKFFPRLYSYINGSSPEEIKGYLEGVEGFARDIHDPKVPLNKRESTLVLGAMLNIESTFLRFDANKDNIIDNQTVVAYDGKTPLTELDVAFKIYRTAIIAVAKLKPDQEKYAKSIFLYMIKYMEIPPQNSWLDNAKFLYFHLWGSTKPIYAKRLNIGVLLYYLVNQNAASMKLKTR